MTSCGSSTSEEPKEDTDFEQGQSSTVVTGANLTAVTTECLYDSEEDTNFQNLNCMLKLKSEIAADEADQSTGLTSDIFNTVTAVEGVDITWGIPPDLGFNCNRIRQSTELFCFQKRSTDLSGWVRKVYTC